MNVRIIKINPDCGWYNEREIFEGKTMKRSKDGNYRFSQSQDLVVGIHGDEWSNSVGFEFKNPEIHENP